MERIPILKMGRFLLVTIQVDMQGGALTFTKRTALPVRSERPAETA